MPGLEAPLRWCSEALLPSAEQPGPDLHHLRGRTERVPGERHREPADVYHPHHRGSSGGLPARTPPTPPRASASCGSRRAQAQGRDQPLGRVLGAELGWVGLS